MMQQQFVTIYGCDTVFRTKYFTGLDPLDLWECNKTIFLALPIYELLWAIFGELVLFVCLLMVCIFEDIEALNKSSIFVNVTTIFVMDQWRTKMLHW